MQPLRPGHGGLLFKTPRSRDYGLPQERMRHQTHSVRRDPPPGESLLRAAADGRGATRPAAADSRPVGGGSMPGLRRRAGEATASASPVAAAAIAVDRTASAASPRRLRSVSLGRFWQSEPLRRLPQYGIRWLRLQQYLGRGGG